MHSSSGDDATLRGLHTPPPGFIHEPPHSPVVQGSVDYDGSSLRMVGALSAPPPPGFNSGLEQRTRRMSQLLWSEDGCRNATADSGINEVSGLDERTTSFSNLAAVVGTGLAESMEDSTRETSPAPPVDSSDSSRHRVFDPEQDLSYARQSRHAASRLIGTTATMSTAASSPGYVSVSSSTLLPPLGSTFPPQSPRRSKCDPDHLSHLSSFAPSLSEKEKPTAAILSRGQSREITSPSFFPGSPNRWSLPAKDLGVTVMEPVELGRSSAPPMFAFAEVIGQHELGTQCGTRPLGHNIQHLDRDMRNVSIIDDPRRSFSEHQSAANGSYLQSEAEIRPFVWDVYNAEPSRTVVILRAHSLHIPDVRSTCEAFGVLEVFRVDFAQKGIIFVGYYDIRSAQYAALELKSCLNRLAAASLSSDSINSSESGINVKYCVPLNWSSAQDESRVVLSDVPPDADEETLTAILSSYGAVRTLCRHGGPSGGYSIVVEFHNIQDAKQALLELDSTQPWGPDVKVELGKRDPVDRKRGRELLALIGSWRHGRGGATPGKQSPSFCTARALGGETARTPASSTSPASSHTPSDGTPTQPCLTAAFRPDNPSENLKSALSAQRQGSSSSASSSPLVSTPELSSCVAYGPQSTLIPNDSCSSRSHQTTQLLLGPDGQYSYVIVNHAAYQHATRPHHHAETPSVQVLHTQPFMFGPHASYVPSGPNTSIHLGPGANGQHSLHWGHSPSTLSPHQFHQAGATSVVRTSPFIDPHAHGYPGPSLSSLPFCTHVPSGAPGSNFVAYTDSSVSSGSGSTPHALGSARDRREVADRTLAASDRDAKHLVLNIDAVEMGQDKRTSVMVRNIPNKYTQQMLLSEFTESGYGPGMIDFFYLPIDFKNRCNRGYAFVNFVDYRDIVPFHRQYYGQHWRVFNSDKICDITYARIQGQAGLLKRFENSALMEKDDEFKPLVFVNHGANKGKRVSFPSPT